MTITKLSYATHANVKINPQDALLVAANNQILELTVAEVPQASTNFPVFLSSNSVTGDLNLCVLTSFTAQSNLFVENGQWCATYLPHNVQTYPFFLINAEGDDKGYSVGIDESSEALSEKEGESLFPAPDKASLHVSQVIKMLESNIPDHVHTTKFIECIQSLNLTKPIEAVLHYEDETAQKLTGMITIDEDKLQALPGETLEDLNKKGYLIPMYGMLISLHQMNHLIQRQNLRQPDKKIRQVKFQVARDL